MTALQEELGLLPTISGNINIDILSHPAIDFEGVPRTLVFFVDGNIGGFQQAFYHLGFEVITAVCQEFQ